MMLAVVIGYLAILLGIGAVSSRRGAASAEDYFLAGRSFGTLVLFMALFGTNVTAFALLGLPGLAYHKGVGVFGFFGAVAAFWGVVVFVLLGYPICNIGKRLNCVTPTQMFAARWQSPAVGYAILLLMLLYTVPYVVIGIMGGGYAISTLTSDADGNGGLSYQAAALLVTVVTVTYTSLGGMRGTAWTNVFQASVFLVFLIIACVGIANELGGPTALMQRIATEKPQLLQHNFPPGIWVTGFLIGPVSIIAFPHMFLRLMAAKDASSLRRTIKLYPWALVLLFLPVTLIGVWGAITIPGLKDKASDGILPILVGDYLPGWLGAVGLAAILAAVMSSLDGQLLTVSTLVSIDVFHRQDDKNARLAGRICVIVFAVLAFAIALMKFNAIYAISKYAFSGYTLIVPVMIAAFFWRRSTAAGVLSGTIVGHGLLLWFYAPGLPRFDWMETLPVFPVALCLIVEVLVLVAVTMMTRPAEAGVVEKFARPFEAEAATGSA